MQVGSGNAEWDFQLFKIGHAQKMLGITFQPLVRSQAQPRKFPLAEICEAQLSGLARYDLERQPGRIGQSGHGTGAIAHDAVDGNALFFKVMQHAEVGDTTRKASAQR